MSAHTGRKRSDVILHQLFTLYWMDTLNRHLDMIYPEDHIGHHPASSRHSLVNRHQTIDTLIWFILKTISDIILHQLFTLQWIDTLNRFYSNTIKDIILHRNHLLALWSWFTKLDLRACGGSMKSYKGILTVDWERTRVCWPLIDSAQGHTDRWLTAHKGMLTVEWERTRACWPLSDSAQGLLTVEWEDTTVHWPLNN